MFKKINKVKILKMDLQMDILFGNTTLIMEFSYFVSGTIGWPEKLLSLYN